MKAFGDSVSPDGRLVIGLPVDLQPTQYQEQRGSAYLYPLAGGQRRLVPGLQDGELPVQWSSDGKSLYVYKRTDSSGRVWLLDTFTGARRAWKEIGQASVGVRRLLITPDGSAYAYDSRQIQSGLFLVEGLN